MSLTSSQIQTLKAFVANSSDPTIVAARTAGNTDQLAKALNAPNVPATNAWRNAMPATGLDGAASYTGYDTLQQGKRDAWSIFLLYAPRDMGVNKNRKVVIDTWGPVIASSISESILLASVEPGSVAEIAIGGSVQADGTVSALKRSFVGPVTQDECQLILAP